MGDLRYGGYVRAEPVDEGDVRQGHDSRSLIYGTFIGFERNGVVDAVQKVDLDPARLLGQPDLPHGGELVLAQYHFVASVKPKCIGNRIDSRGSAGDDRNLLRLGVDEAREGAAQEASGIFHPFFPGRGRKVLRSLPLLYLRIPASTASQRAPWEQL